MPPSGAPLFPRPGLGHTYIYIYIYIYICVVLVLVLLLPLYYYQFILQLYHMICLAQVSVRDLLAQRARDRFSKGKKGGGTKGGKIPLYARA